MNRTFERNLAALADVFTFLGEASVQYELETGVKYAVNMAVEELFTNMIKYNSGGTSGIDIILEKEEDSIIMRMIDTDSEPFDVTGLNDVDTSAPLDKRRPGGLGIHLVKCLMDEVSYEYKGRTTKIRLVKKI